MTARFPWGSGPAPALDCHACGTRVGKQRFHCIIDNTRVLCGRCMNLPQLHAKYYPDCPVAWHDMYDHGVNLASRAATDPEKRSHA
jgi:hypothetical protein